MFPVSILRIICSLLKKLIAYANEENILNKDFPALPLCLCLTAIHSLDCFKNAVGVGSTSIIRDYQMSASSHYDIDNLAAYGRLNGDRGDGWCAKKSERNDEWLQVDLGKPVEVGGLATQGDINGNEWVKAFKLSYSYNGTRWKNYQDASSIDVVRRNLINKLKKKMGA